MDPKRPDPSRHPCFNAETRCATSRVHLPVASRCNVQCNFCDRRYSCVNESRPGVTCTMLKPQQALEYIHRQIERLPNLAVVGIAGPGDPFANPDETLETFRLVHENYPELLLCVATNGLALPEYIPTLSELNVSHVTLTVNAVDPQISSKVYQWMRYDKKTHTGIEAAEHLWFQQATSIVRLSQRDILVKVNSIYIPGVNDQHIETIAKTVSELGASVLNIMPLKPTSHTAFADLEEPSATDVGRVRLKAKSYLPQMSHCSRCRADAAGLIGQEQSAEDRILLREIAEMAVTSSSPKQSVAKLRVAVASMEGMLINQHVGEAEELSIYELTEGTWKMLEKRPCPEPGGGNQRWEKLAALIADCQKLLVSGIGPGPLEVLKNSQLDVEVLEGMISHALDILAKGGDLQPMRKQAAFACGSSCSGTGGGCG